MPFDPTTARIFNPASAKRVRFDPSTATLFNPATAKKVVQTESKFSQPMSELGVEEIPFMDRMGKLSQEVEQSRKEYNEASNVTGTPQDILEAVTSPAIGISKVAVLNPLEGAYHGVKRAGRAGADILHDLGDIPEAIGALRNPIPTKETTEAIQKPFKNLPENALEMGIGAAHGVFGLQMAVPTPVNLAFNVGMESAGKMNPKAVEYAFQLVTKSVNPTSNIGKKLAEIGDVAASIALLHGLNTYLPKGYKYVVGKMQKGEVLTPQESKIVEQVTEENTLLPEKSEGVVIPESQLPKIEAGAPAEPAGIIRTAHDLRGAQREAQGILNETERANIPFESRKSSLVDAQGRPLENIPEPTPLSSTASSVEPTAGGQPRAVSTPDYAKEAEKLGVRFDSFQDFEDGGKPRPMFTDPRTGSTFSAKEGQTVAQALKENRKPFEQAGEILPNAVRIKYALGLEKAGVKVEGLTDKAIIKKYEESGLDKPAPKEEAPVSQGGDISVRGEANKEMVERIQKKNGGRPAKYSQIAGEDYPVLSAAPKIKPDWILKDGKVEMREEFAPLGDLLDLTEKPTAGQLSLRGGKKDGNIDLVAQEQGFPDAETYRNTLISEKSKFEKYGGYVTKPQIEDLAVRLAETPDQLAFENKLNELPMSVRRKVESQLNEQGKQNEQTYLESEPKVADYENKIISSIEAKEIEGVLRELDNFTEGRTTEVKTDLTGKGNQYNAFAGQNDPAYQAKAPTTGIRSEKNIGTEGSPLFEKPKGESNQNKLFELGTTALAYGGANVLIDQSGLDDDTKKKLKGALTALTIAGLGSVLMSKQAQTLLADIRSGVMKKALGEKWTGEKLASEIRKETESFLKSDEAKAFQPKDIEAIRRANNVGEFNRGVQTTSKELQNVGTEVKTAQTEEGLKYAFNINKEKLNVSPEDLQKLDATVERIKPQLEKEKGKPLTNAEVIEDAQTSDLLRRAISREQTEKVAAAILKTRQAVAAGAQGQGVTKQFIDNIRILSTYASDAGRTLQKFSITADPSLTNIKEAVIKKLVDLGLKTDDILKASEGVDFNNAKEVAKFYREFVKPNWKDLLDEYRYINLLSSPKTHIVNMFSNLLQGGVIAPATKLYQGGIDYVQSSLTGRERQVYARSVPVYYKGLLHAMPEAVKNAMGVLRGGTFTLRPDLDQIPSMGQGVETTNPVFKVASKGLAKYNEKMRPVTTALEAADIFLQTMIKGGEKEAISYRYTRQGKQLDEIAIDAEATQRAKEYLFRAELDPDNLTGQGKILSWLDKGASVAYKFRNLPVVGWTVPFIRTPMNILKQGIEYSPAGFTTLIGSQQKQLQLSKAMLGSTVFAGAAMLVANNESTWEAPTSPSEKEKFYQSGKQPYSVKIGNTWYSYSKLGVLAYPIALAAAVKYHTEQSKQSRETNTLQKIEAILGSQAKFFADQSYVQGISDLLDAVSKGENYDVDKLLTGIPSQLIPLVSLQNWVGNLIDPVYRKPKGFIEGLEMKSPFTRYQVPISDKSSKEDILGMPRQVVNAFSPIQMSTDNTSTTPYFPKGGIPASRMRRSLMQGLRQ